MRLNSGESETRRYVIAADTLTAVEPAVDKPLRPEGDSGKAASMSVEPKPTKVSDTSPSRSRNDVELSVGSRKAVVPPPAQKRTPGDRIVASTKPKASTPKQRQPAVQKRAPVYAKDKDNAKSGQRSKQSQIKHSENRLRATVKLTQIDNKQQDSGLEQPMPEDSRPGKSFAELRAMFQAQSS